MTKSGTQFEVLNSKDHAELRVITSHGPAYHDVAMQVMVFPFEFRNVQACYPIFFQVDANDQYYPVALLGFEEGENLFQGESDWEASYVPAMVRREPFLVGVQDVEEQQARVLSIDMNHPRVSNSAGELLFKPLGGRTDFLEEQANLLEALHDGLGHCQGFTQALVEHELIEDVALEIKMGDGSSSQLIGLKGVNEERVQALSGDVLEMFNREGYLMPLFMTIASMSNMQTLIDLKNSKVAAKS